MSEHTYDVRWIVETSGEVKISYDGEDLGSSYGTRAGSNLQNIHPDSGSPHFDCSANMYAPYGTAFYLGGDEIAVFYCQATYPVGSLDWAENDVRFTNRPTDDTGNVSEGIYVSKQDAVDDYFKTTKFKASLWVTTVDSFGRSIRTRKSFIFDNVGTVFPALVGSTQIDLWQGSWDEHGNGYSSHSYEMYPLCSKFHTDFHQILKLDGNRVVTVSSRIAFLDWGDLSAEGINEQMSWAMRTFTYTGSSDGTRCYLSNVSTSTNFRPVNTSAYYTSVYNRLSVPFIQIDDFKSGLQNILDESNFSSTRLDSTSLLLSDPQASTFAAGRTLSITYNYVFAVDKSDNDFWVSYGKADIAGADPDYIEYAIYRSKTSNSFRAVVLGTANQVNRLSTVYRYLGGEVINENGCLPLNETDRLVIASPRSTYGKFVIFDRTNLIVKAISKTDRSFYRPIKADNNRPEIVEYIDTTPLDVLTDEDASSFIVYTQNAWQLANISYIDEEENEYIGNAFGKKVPNSGGPQTIDFETNPVTHFEWDYHPGENRKNLSNPFTIRSEYDCRQNAFHANVNTLGFSESKYSNNALGYDPLRLRSSAIKLDVSNYNRILAGKQQKILNIDRLHLIFYKPYEVFKIGGNTENSGTSNHFENETIGYIDVDIYTQSNGGVMSMWMLGGQFHLYLVDRYQGTQLVYPKFEFLNYSAYELSRPGKQWDTEWQSQGTVIMYPYRHYIMRVRVTLSAFGGNAVNDDEINPDDMWIIAFDYGKEMEWDRL